MGKDLYYKENKNKLDFKVFLNYESSCIKKICIWIKIGRNKERKVDL